MLPEKLVSLFKRAKAYVYDQKPSAAVLPDPSSGHSEDCDSLTPGDTPPPDDVANDTPVPLHQPECLPTYVLPLKEEKNNVKGCRVSSLNNKFNNTKTNRTIMVLGATGAGKSTLINGMINYILGVKWKDKYRIKLVHEDPSKSQTSSQTSEVTVYKLNHQEGFQIPYSLTIIDTPGFGDTGGIERDIEITGQLRNLFSSDLGVNEIDAVCFVVQAPLVRLTPSQKYVFDSVLSIFGKDVEENIQILVTFADGQRPPVIEAISASGVPCPKNKAGQPVHFKFNNSVLFSDNKTSGADSSDVDREDDNEGEGEDEDEDDDGEDFDEMFWKMGTQSMKKFFSALSRMKTKSLTLTKEVLRERQHLENLVEHLQIQVRMELEKLEDIRQTTEKLRDNEAEVKRNEEFEIEVKVTKQFKVDISGTGMYITNCQVCHYTCHDNCAYSNDADKRRCCAMGPDGNCTVCPKKCVWSVHHNQKYKFEYKEVTEKKTLDDLKKKYQVATAGKKTFETLLDKMNEEYEQVQLEAVRLMERSSQSLNRLKEIALKPNPLSAPEYIDLLIKAEKCEKTPGWKKRVESLMEMRQKAELMAKVGRGEKPLAK
ncbi:uncharacterized protein V6R79_004313 [Siganus canaliculatus]